jgi:hypothetical protein
MTRLEAPIPPELEGNLCRLKNNSSWVGSWVTRYFQVSAIRKTLEYFHKRPKSEYEKPTSDRIIDLSDITSVTDFGELQFQIQAGKRCMMLQASSKADHSCWVNGLSRYIEELREYELHTQNRY